MEQRDIGEVFLINFLNAIANTIKPSQVTFEREQEFPEYIQKENKIEMVPEGIKSSQNIQTGKKIIEIGQNRNVPNMKSLAMPDKFAQVRHPRTSQQFPSIDINQKSTSEKLNFLIKDPAVTELECIGSEQNLLVKKAGVIQKTPVRLSIEEIYQLIAEFSQKTKIPVLDGTIKAAFNNLILTAVLSVMLGPRFILQKKNPFQQIV